MPIPTRVSDLKLCISPTPAQWEAGISETDTRKLVLFGINELVCAQKTGGGLTDAQLRKSPVPVSATSWPLPSGAATEATLLAVEAAIGGSSGAGTPSTIDDSATSVLIAAANTARTGISVVNDSSATLYLLCAAGSASLINYTVPLVTGAYWEAPYGYTGILNGIWASDPGDGAARVTEYTA